MARLDESLASLAPPTMGRLDAVRTARPDLTPIASSSVDSLADVFAKQELWKYPFGRGFSRDETAAFVESQAQHSDTLGFGLWLATIRAEELSIGFVGLLFLPFFRKSFPRSKSDGGSTPMHGDSATPPRQQPLR